MSNTEIWACGSESNKVSELRGKFEVGPGKYRIALRGRLYCALFLSFDEGKTYQKAAYLYNPSNDAIFHLENDESYHDFTIDQKKWVYFKSVLTHFAQGKEPYIGLGLGKFNENNEVEVAYLNAYEQSYVPDPPFITKDVYRRSYSQTYLKEYDVIGSLVECNYDKWDNSFNITNIFDDNDMNLIHTSLNNPVSSENPFMIFVDLGKTILANIMTIYAAPNFEYQPKSYILMAGTTKEDLKVLLDVNSAPKNSNKAADYVLNFDLTYIRYYKLIITETYDNKRNFVAFRYIKFGDGFTSNILPIDDERVFLFNEWERNQKLCTFGHLWVGNGNENSHAKGQFAFNGSQIAVNAYYGKGFGTYDIYIDGKKRKTINLEKENAEKVELSYVSPRLPDGEHVFGFESSNHFNIDSMFFRKPTELGSYVEDDDEYVNNEFDDKNQPPIPDDGHETDNTGDDNEDNENTNDNVNTGDDENTNDNDETDVDDDGITTSKNEDVVITISNEEEDYDNDNNNGNSSGGNKNKKSQTILIVGVVIGLIVAGALSAVITVALLKKKREVSSEALME